MPDFSMMCSCGDLMQTEAGSREEAVSKLQGAMDQAAVTAHMNERHPGEPAPTVEQVHGMIAQNLRLVPA
jgi:hypothetical protein